MAKTYTLGEEMKAYRGQEGLTQRQLGELLGVKQVDISRIENGRKEPPPEVEAAFKAHRAGLKALDAPVSILHRGGGESPSRANGSGPAGARAPDEPGGGGGAIQGEA